MRRLPGVEASTGSLGQGLSLGIGHALAARLDGYDYHVCVLIGDGESDEGQVWEAAMAAEVRARQSDRHRRSERLPADRPGQAGHAQLLPIAEKWRAFGWPVQEIDGHDMEQILQALSAAQAVRGQPQAIVAHIKKGKGLSPFEKDDVSRKHGVVLKPDEAKMALAELDRM